MQCQIMKYNGLGEEEPCLNEAIEGNTCCEECLAWAREQRQKARKLKQVAETSGYANGRLNL